MATEIAGYPVRRRLAARSFLVESPSGEKRVLKLNPASDAEADARFLRAARRLAELDHPGIARTLDAGVQAEGRYLCREYLPGRTLKDAGADFGAAESLRIAAQVAAALEHAAQGGFVHAHLKPANILLALDGAACVLDFIPDSGAAVDSASWISPEQTRGGTPDPRSDIYSLGALFYWLLSGGAEPKPGRLPGNLRVFQDIVDKALATNPDHRYQSAGEMLTALAAVTEEDLEAVALATPHWERRRRGETRSAEREIGVATEGENERQLPPAAAKTATIPVRAAATGRSRWRLALSLSMALPLVSLLILQRDRLDEWSAALEGPRPVRTEAVEETPAPAAAEPSSAESEPSEPTAEPSSAESESSEPTAEPTDEPRPQAATEAINRAAVLRKELQQDLERAPELAALYRQFQSRAWADAGLTELSDRLRTRARDALERGDAAAANRALALAEQSFPDEPPETLELEQLQGDYRTLQQVESWLERARNRMQEDALTRPSGDNALAAFREALQLDPGHPEAQRGIAAIATRYREMAEEALAEGDRDEAAEMVERGLSADSEHSELQALRERLAESDDDNSLERAREQLAAGNYLDPEGDSAYHLFRQVLSEDPGQQQALRGLADIERWLRRRIETHINRNQFGEARELLATGRQYFPEGRYWSPLDRALEETVAAVQNSG